MLVTLRKIKLSVSAVRANSRQFRMYSSINPLSNRIGMGRFMDERTPEGLRVMRADAIVDSTGRHWTHWSALVDPEHRVRYIHVANDRKNELRKGFEQDRVIDIALRTTDFLDPNRIGDGIWIPADDGLTLFTSKFNTGRDFQSLSRAETNDMEIQIVLATAGGAGDDAIVLNHKAVVALFAGSGVSTDRDSSGTWYLSGRRGVHVAHDGQVYTVTLIDGAKQAKGTGPTLVKALDKAASTRFTKRKDK